MPDGIIGDVALIGRSDGNIIGSAKLEKIGRNTIVIVDASDIPDAIINGFGLGSFRLSEDLGKDSNG
jgi:hypothetical protein